MSVRGEARGRHVAVIDVETGKVIASAKLSVDAAILTPQRIQEIADCTYRVMCSFKLPATGEA